MHSLAGASVDKDEPEYEVDVALHKAEIIERCLQRVRQVYADSPLNLRGDLTKQDSIVLNIQRGAEAAIDLAMHLVRRLRLGIPRDSRDAFRLLEAAGHLEPDLSLSLQNMVGFRNIAIHQYQALDLDVVEAVIHGSLADLERFSTVAIRLVARGS
jgi:uncharacterized protein YutE (UPF0331/DUF86 family)